MLPALRKPQHFVRFIPLSQVALRPLSSIDIRHRQPTASLATRYIRTRPIQPIMSGPSLKRGVSAISAGPWPDRDRQRRKRQRVPKTCEWILEEEAYRAWRDRDDTSSPALWIHGPAGGGKSFLAQFVLDDLAATDDPSAVLSCFCDASSTPSSVLQGLLAQLVGQPDLDEDVRNIIIEAVGESSAGKPGMPSDVSFKLWDVMATVVEQGPPLTILVDGLDELPTKYLEPPEFDLGARLVNLTALVSGYVRVLILSRPNASISRAMDGSPSVQMTPLKTQDDLARFIESQLSRHETLASFADQIKESLLRQSEGNFLWTSLSVQALSQESSSEPVLSRLEHLPPSLDELYTGVLERQAAELSAEQIPLRNIVLRWMVFAVRPMTVVEVANAVALETLAFIPDFERAVLEACGSLVRVEDGVLKLLHHSLRDYLLGNSPALRSLDGIESPSANHRMAATLQAYLHHPRLSSITDAGGRFRQNYPLAGYATLYWVHHVSASAMTADLGDQVVSFFGKPQAKTWFDTLLPSFLPDSVFPVPPRPAINARFFYLTILQSQLVNAFEPAKRPEVKAVISDSLRTAYEQFLEAERQQGDKPSVNTLKRLLELGEAYSWLPAHKDRARGLLEEAAELASQLSSPEASALRISAYQALADERKRSGHYEEAEALLQQLLGIASEILPPGDPGFMFALDALGWVSMRLGKLDAAASHLQQALDIAMARFGSGSPFTLRSRVTLAEVLGKLGRHAEAEVLCAALHAQLARHLRDGTPLPRDSVSHLGTLAAIYMQEQKYDQARATYRVVAEDRRKIFGAEHGMTMWADMQLGIATMKGGDLPRARELLSDLLPRQREVLGADHQDVKDVAAMLEELSA